MLFPSASASIGVTVVASLLPSSINASSARFRTDCDLSAKAFTNAVNVSLEVARISDNSSIASVRTLEESSVMLAINASRIASVDSPFFVRIAPILPKTFRTSARARDEPFVRTAIREGMTASIDAGEVGRTSSNSASASRKTLSDGSLSAFANPIAIASTLRLAFRSRSPISPNTSIASLRTRSDGSWSRAMSASVPGFPISSRKSTNSRFTRSDSSAKVGTTCASNSDCHCACNARCFAFSVFSSSLSSDKPPSGAAVAS